MNTQKEKDYTNMIHSLSDLFPFRFQQATEFSFIYFPTGKNFLDYHKKTICKGFPFSFVFSQFTKYTFPDYYS